MIKLFYFLPLTPGVTEVEEDIQQDNALSQKFTSLNLYFCGDACPTTKIFHEREIISIQGSLLIFFQIFCCPGTLKVLFAFGIKDSAQIITCWLY